MRLVILILAAVSVVVLAAGAAPVNAATRDITFQWEHGCETVDGDTLDENADGTCEGLQSAELDNVGWRFYTESGSFITGIPEDGTRLNTIRYNLPWGLNQCHYMTAVAPDPVNPGQVLESAPSNLGACIDVIPGRPRPPNLLN